MAHSHVPQLSESIDQVIQSGQSLSAFQPNPRGSESNISTNRTTALPPLPPSPPRSSRSRPSSPRQDQVRSPLRSSPPASSTERRRVTSDRGARDTSTYMKSPSRGDDEASGSSKSETLVGSAPAGNNAMIITDFFSSEVFQIVIHNPITAHRLLKFCQSRACGENMEFLQKVKPATPLLLSYLTSSQVDAYNRALDEVTQILSTIHTTYTSTDAPRQIDLPYSQIKRISMEIKQATGLVLPGLESIFVGAQDQVERLLASDIYPRFVKHQVTASAASALANHRERFQGLGDCFCLTDPLFVF
jgi:hypothetical protein